MHFDSNVWLPVMVVVLTFIVSHIISGNSMREATKSGGWYDKLKKSYYEPPKFFYSLVWTLLYIFVAIIWANANYILSPNGELGENNITYYCLNYSFAILMFLNICWSSLFFTNKNFILSLLIIVIAIFFTIVIIYILSDPIFPSWMMILMIVYLLWILFATYLNYYVARNNFSLEREKDLSYIFV